MLVVSILVFATLSFSVCVHFGVAVRFIIVFRCNVFFSARLLHVTGFFSAILFNIVLKVDKLTYFQIGNFVCIFAIGNCINVTLMNRSEKN